mgnify:CR=1 FL=1
MGEVFFCSCISKRKSFVMIVMNCYDEFMKIYKFLNVHVSLLTSFLYSVVVDRDCKIGFSVVTLFVCVAVVVVVVVVLTTGFLLVTSTGLFSVLLTVGIGNISSG